MLRRAVLRAACFGALLGLSGAVHGGIVSYTVDPSQSTLTLSGAVRYYFNGSNFGFVPQSGGAMVASFGGTITGDLTNSVLTVSGGSAITALANPAGPFLPAGPGTVDAYGMLTFGSGGSSAANRIYDAQLDLTSGTLTDGSAFTGTVAYAGSSGGIFPFFNSEPQPLAGVSAGSAAAGLVSLTTSGFVETLTVPIDSNLILFGNGTGVEMRLTGSIVATRTVPAPGAAAVVGLAAVGALGRRRRASGR